MSFKILSTLVKFHNTNMIRRHMSKSARAMFTNLTNNQNKLGSRRHFTSDTKGTGDPKVLEYGTISDLKLQLASIMGVEAGYKPMPTDRSHLLKYLPKTQEELPKRSMQDSFLVALIPLSTDKLLQEKYITFLGSVRLGRLLEDMDIFAVMVAQKHIMIPNHPKEIPAPHTLVTALVDTIEFSEYTPKPQADIKISGHVSWVGKSSMEVVVWLEQHLHGTWQRITRALFLIAARDPTNHKSAIINAIEPANEREKEILSGGEQRKKRRLKNQGRHVTKVIPDMEEQKIIHDLYLRSSDPTDVSLRKRVLPPGCVWMSTCTISNSIFSHPEDRNLHNTVFGGFIMRQAEELSWTLCYIFSKYRPVLKSISDINFTRPVTVNSLIQMHAQIVFTQMQYMQVLLYAETYNPVTGKSDTTNTFHFTYEVPELVQEVLPQTYHEAMMYIDGRRHFMDIMQAHSKDVIKPIQGEHILDKAKL